MILPAVTKLLEILKLTVKPKAVYCHNTVIPSSVRKLLVILKIKPAVPTAVKIPSNVRVTDRAVALPEKVDEKIPKVCQ